MSSLRRFSLPLSLGRRGVRGKAGALTPAQTASIERVTEADEIRITEDGDVRVTEEST